MQTVLCSSPPAPPQQRPPHSLPLQKLEPFEGLAEELRASSGPAGLLWRETVGSVVEAAPGSKPVLPLAQHVP